MSRISDDCTRCWPLAIPDVGLFAIYIASLHPHLDVLPLIVPVVVLLVPVLLIREGTSGVQRLISVTAEPLATTHLG